MELTPLYDLRERLKAGAIAGTALLGEDFRLTRALEALAPLEGASPVFKKIGQGVRSLLATDCPDPAAALLEALSLCDAVLTTQGSVNISGPVEPMAITAHGKVQTNAPYSVLAPLAEALKGSVSGRYTFIVNTHEQRPELFRDYRVSHALVSALGAPYGEMADRAEEWLSENGAEVAPILKMGFDPAGKREMVRRIHVLENVAGAGENAFYLSLLENSEKEVRAAAVYALRHDEANAETLAGLCKTEKGAAKKAAHWALARLEAPAAWAYWEDFAQKKPQQAASYMVLSTWAKAGTLIGSILCNFLTLFEQGTGVWNQDLHKALQSLLEALVGKSGPEVCDFYRRGAALGNLLDGTPEGEKRPANFIIGCGYTREMKVFSRILPVILRYSLVLNPSEDLLNLAEEMWSVYGELWQAPKLAAMLLTQKSEAAAEAAEPLISQPFSLFKKRDTEADYRVLQAVLGAVCWNNQRRRQEMCVNLLDPVTESPQSFSQPLCEPLSQRWYEGLQKLAAKFPNTGYLALMVPLIQPENKPLCEFMGGAFFRLISDFDRPSIYLEAMKTCGWKDCKGLAVRYVQQKKDSSGQVSYYLLEHFLRQLPGSGTHRAGEVESLIQLVQRGKVGLQGGDLEDLKKLAEELRNSDTNTAEV